MNTSKASYTGTFSSQDRLIFVRIRVATVVDLGLDSLGFVDLDSEYISLGKEKTEKMLTSIFKI
jgi:hypothetical protein